MGFQHTEAKSACYIVMSLCYFKMPLFTSWYCKAVLKLLISKIVQIQILSNYTLHFCQCCKFFIKDGIIEKHSFWVFFCTWTTASFIHSTCNMLFIVSFHHCQAWQSFHWQSYSGLDNQKIKTSKFKLWSFAFVHKML